MSSSHSDNEIPDDFTLPLPPKTPLEIEAKAAEAALASKTAKAEKDKATLIADRLKLEVTDIAIPRAKEILASVTNYIEHLGGKEAIEKLRTKERCRPVNWKPSLFDTEASRLKNVSYIETFDLLNKIQDNCIIILNDKSATDAQSSAFDKIIELSKDTTKAIEARFTTQISKPSSDSKELEKLVHSKAGKELTKIYDVMRAFSEKNTVAVKGEYKPQR